MIGNRLRLARKGAGLSLRTLAHKLDNQVSAQALGKYERDEMMPSSQVLMALSDALGVSETYLLGQGIELTQLEFRKKKITSKKAEAQVEAQVLSHVERYLQIEELVGCASAEWTMPTGFPYQIQELAQVEGATKELRSVWLLGNDPMALMSEFLEERGIKVLALDLPDTVHGLNSWVKRPHHSDVPVIIINQKDRGERQRFTLAHELGHLLLTVDPSLDEEKVAQQFASALLMPDTIIRAEIGRHRQTLTSSELFYLKPFFGVSVQALVYRCRDLGIINDVTFRQLFMEFTKAGWRSPPYQEPHPVPQENPCRFQRLCFRAIAEAAISREQGAELLGISLTELETKMEPSTDG